MKAFINAGKEASWWFHSLVHLIRRNRINENMKETCSKSRKIEKENWWLSLVYMPSNFY